MGVFDQLNGASGRNDYNAKKTATLCNIPLMKKIKKKQIKLQFFKNDHFGVFFLILSATVQF